jgi:hypothetical protein
VQTPDQNPTQVQNRRPDYNQIFQSPFLATDPIPAQPKPSWFFRQRNSLWWVVVFLVLSVTALAFMKSDFAVVDEAESGCGDSWPF